MPDPVELFVEALRQHCEGHHADLLDFFYDNIDERLLAGDFAFVTAVCAKLVEDFAAFPCSLHHSTLILTKPWAKQFDAERAVLAARLGMPTR